MLYRVKKLSVEKVCQIKNFEQANFSDFQWLAMSWEINPQVYNWTQIIRKRFVSKFLSSKQGFL